MTSRIRIASMFLLFALCIFWNSFAAPSSPFITMTYDDGTVYTVHDLRFYVDCWQAGGFVIPPDLIVETEFVPIGLILQTGKIWNVLPSEDNLRAFLEIILAPHLSHSHRHTERWQADRWNGSNQWKRHMDWKKCSRYSPGQS